MFFLAVDGEVILEVVGGGDDEVWVPVIVALVPDVADVTVGAVAVDGGGVWIAVWLEGETDGVIVLFLCVG